MMRVPARVLIQDLLDKTEYVLSQAQLFLQLSSEDLNTKPNGGGWSVAQCLEHMMLYNDYYLTLVEKELANEENKWHTHNTIYKASLIGDYFSKSMLPNEKGEVRKMSSPKAKNPSLIQVRENIIDQFLAQQIFQKEVIHRCDTMNLNKGKIPVTILPLIKLSIGDTLRFITYHNVRHTEQATKTLKQIKLSQEL